MPYGGYKIFNRLDFVNKVPGYSSACIASQLRSGYYWTNCLWMNKCRYLFHCTCLCSSFSVPKGNLASSWHEAARRYKDFQDTLFSSLFSIE